MIKINFSEPDTENWKEWVSQCEEAQIELNNAINGGECLKIDASVYKGEKYHIKYDIFVNLDQYFYGKCAYCESDIAADQPGDIEHFRPKSEIRDINNQLVMIDGEDGPIPHPGYFWLAYNWKNLLPACKDCNSITKQKTGGQLIGKGNRFPVQTFRATLPGEECHEGPLLIKPVLQDPKKHLTVDSTGVITERNNSLKGKTCIEIFGLNKREALVEGRKRAYESTKNQVTIILMTLNTNNTAEAQNQINRIKKVLEGKEPYSAAGRAALEDSKASLGPFFELFSS